MQPTTSLDRLYFSLRHFAPELDKKIIDMALSTADSQQIANNILNKPNLTFEELKVISKIKSYLDKPKETLLTEKQKQKFKVIKVVFDVIIKNHGSAKAKSIHNLVQYFLKDTCISKSLEDKSSSKSASEKSPKSVKIFDQESTALPAITKIAKKFEQVVAISPPKSSPKLTVTEKSHVKLGQSNTFQNTSVELATKVKNTAELQQPADQAKPSSSKRTFSLASLIEIPPDDSIKTEPYISVSPAVTILLSSSQLSYDDLEDLREALPVDYENLSQKTITLLTQAVHQFIDIVIDCKPQNIEYLNEFINSMMQFALHENTNILKIIPENKKDALIHIIRDLHNKLLLANFEQLLQFLLEINCQRDVEVKELVESTVYAILNKHKPGVDRFINILREACSNLCTGRLVPICEKRRSKKIRKLINLLLNDSKKTEEIFTRACGAANLKDVYGLKKMLSALLNDIFITPKDLETQGLPLGPKYAKLLKCFLWREQLGIERIAKKSKSISTTDEDRKEISRELRLSISMRNALICGFTFKK